MITVARKVVNHRSERCGRVLLLDLVKDESGRQMLLCKDCINRVSGKVLTDPLRDIRWPECENKTMQED